MPGEAPQPLHARRRLGAGADLGHGHRQPGPDRRRLPEVYLTSIGSNRLETLADGAAEPTYDDIAHDRGITATTPWIGRPIDPSTSWHPEFDDVNNDGRIDLYVSKGNVDAMPDTPLEDPNELFLGLPDGSFRRAAKQAGIRTRCARAAPR